MSTAASSTTEPPQAENEHTGRLEGAEGTTASMDRRLGGWLICAGLIALAATLMSARKVIQRAHGGILLGPLMLRDHGGPNAVLEGEVRISTPGAQRRRAPRPARSSGNRRARHITREHVCQSDVLAG